MVYMNKTFTRIDIRDGKWKSVNKYMGRIKSVIKNVNDYETALNILKQDRLEARKLKTDDAKHFYYNVIDIVEHRVNVLASLFLLDLKEQQDLYLNRDTDAISKYRYECRFKVNLSNVHSCSVNILNLTYRIVMMYPLCRKPNMVDTVKHAIMKKSIGRLM